MLFFSKTSTVTPTFYFINPTRAISLITKKKLAEIYGYFIGKGGAREARGLMVSALDSGASAPGLSPGRGHCLVFLGKTLYSHGASLHPGV